MQEKLREGGIERFGFHTVIVANPVTSSGAVAMRGKPTSSEAIFSNTVTIAKGRDLTQVIDPVENERREMELKAIMEGHFEAINLGDDQALAQISPQRRQAILADGSGPRFDLGIHFISKFYNTPAFIDEFSPMAKGGQEQRREWEISKTSEYGGELFQKYNPKTKLSSTYLGLVRTGLGFLIQAVKEAPLKAALGAIRKDVEYFLDGYMYAPLNVKFEVAKLHIEDTQLIFKLLAGEIDPRDVLEQREKLAKARHKIVLRQILAADSEEVEGNLEEMERIESAA